MQKVATNKQKIDLKDLPKRLSPEEFRETLLKANDSQWKGFRQKEPALFYTVEFGIAPGQENFVKNRLAGEPMLNLNNSMNGKVSVIHSGEVTRINALGRTILGENYSIVKDPAQGSLFIDHKTKSFLRIPKEIESSHQLKEKLKSEVRVEKQSGDRANAVIEVNHPYQIRYELILDTNPEFAAYRGKLICHTIGCEELFGPSGIDLSPITNTGVPVAGKMSMKVNGNFEPMSQFKVSKLSWQPFNAEDFAIPSGYTSLKELSKKQKQSKETTRFGPPMRLSNVSSFLKRPLYDRDMPFPYTPPEHGEIIHDEFGIMQPTQRTYDGGGLRFPTCFEETYGSQIANVFDQKLLDDVKFFVNGITKRLDDFSGAGGNLVINWMDQFKAHSDALAIGDPGGGLYLMLHDETPMNGGYPMKKGLIDKLAVKDLGNLLVNGNNLNDLGLTAVLQARVNTVLANASITPTNRFSSFTLEEQGDLIDAYVFKKIGTINLNYPSSTGSQKIFYDLLSVRLDNIEFDININNTPVIDTLEYDTNSIHLVIKLPDASGKAFMSRWPTGKYWAVVGLSSLGCLLFPPLCALAATALIVGVFIGLDFAFVSLELANLEVDAHIRFVPNASNVLQPDVSLTLDADVSASYISVVPTGVHQILSLIYTIILNHTSLVIDQLESQLQTQLNKFLKEDLALTYPPKFGPVPLVGINSTTEFAAVDRLYIEQGLNAGITGVICPYITQVDAEVKSKILQLRDEFKADFEDPVAAFARLSLIGWPGADFTSIARYYAGTVLSQNFINHYVYVLWRLMRFNYDFTVTETEKLYTLLQAGFRQFRTMPFDERRVRAHLWPAVPPRTVFTPKPASEGKYYSTTFFDDVRICFEVAVDNKRIPNKLEFLFSAQTFTEIGFGGFNASEGKLDILKASDRVFDIYFDLDGLGVQVIHPEVESFRLPGMQPRVNFNYGALDAPEVQEMFRLAMTFALASRNVNVIPRAPGDDTYTQRYPIGDPSLQLVCRLVPFLGNLYVSKGVSGTATAIYDGALNIDTLNKTTALLIRALS